MEVKNKLTVMATISSKNQITIPKEVRHRLNVQSKDKLAFEIREDGNIVLKKAGNDLWGIVAEQQEVYGVFDSEDIEWGIDEGEEVID